MSVIITLLLIIFLIGLYFVPTMVAADRDNHVAAVFVLNLLLGWTMLGWVIALVIAFWQNNAKNASPSAQLDEA